MNGHIPEWAIERACELAGLFPNRVAAKRQGLRAFARYIAEHEDEPVDPLEAAAAKILDDWQEGRLGRGTVRTVIEVALKRGIEIGEAK